MQQKNGSYCSCFFQYLRYGERARNMFTWFHLFLHIPFLGELHQLEVSLCSVHTEPYTFNVHEDCCGLTIETYLEAITIALLSSFSFHNGRRLKFWDPLFQQVVKEKDIGVGKLPFLLQVVSLPDGIKRHSFQRMWSSIPLSLPILCEDDWGLETKPYKEVVRLGNAQSGEEEVKGGAGLVS